MWHLKTKTLTPGLRHEAACTSGDPPVVEASITDPYRSQTPAPLWDGPRFRGTRIAEALSACTTVVLGVVGLKLFATFMAFLKHTDHSFKTFRHSTVSDDNACPIPG